MKRQGSFDKRRLPLSAIGACGGKNILAFLLLLAALPLWAQSPGTYKKRIAEDTIVAFKDRWSFHTNAVDWLLTVPNASVEFDLSRSVYNKLTLRLGGKWNWQTAHNYLPSNVFNVWEVRPEVRRYWRTEYRNSAGSEPTLKERLFSRQRKRPRYWRAYYMGIYALAGGYSVKFSNEGVQGSLYGLGVSGGYSIPLYSYRDNYIDIEFGGSIGLGLTDGRKYKLDRENNAYVPSGPKKSMRVVPFPMVNDLHVSFVYRFSSIKDKYKRINHEKIQAKEQRRLEKKRLKDSIRTARIVADSLADARKAFVKDSVRQARLLADSLADVRKAFVKDSVRQARIMADSLADVRQAFVEDSIRQARQEAETPPAAPSDSIAAMPGPPDTAGETPPDSTTATAPPLLPPGGPEEGTPETPSDSSATLLLPPEEPEPHPATETPDSTAFLPLPETGLAEDATELKPDTATVQPLPEELPQENGTEETPDTTAVPTPPAGLSEDATELKPDTAETPAPALPEPL